MLLRVLVVSLVLTAISVQAHFILLIPNLDVVRNIQEPSLVKVTFTHPMSNGPVMEMSRPVQFGVMEGGRKTDLTKVMVPVKISGKTGYEAHYSFTRPGDYIFYIEPAPYWEPAEQKFIVHYTKVVVDVCGAEEGWDAMVGFPVEIKPLTRPYSIYAGNVFQGIVTKKGKPVPFAEVEVEYYNKERKFKPPTSAHITQVIKSDVNGVFTYSPIKSGWWGFAALITGDRKMKSPDGKMVDVELGAVMWIHACNMVPAGE